jgi:hypothetical protein
MQGRHETHSTGSVTATRMQEGDIFDCENCGCEIRLTRHGDPEKMLAMDAFTCCCGTRLTKRQESAR